jgi:hypothetical protein
MIPFIIRIFPFASCSTWDDRNVYKLRYLIQYWFVLDLKLFCAYPRSSIHVIKIQQQKQSFQFVQVSKLITYFDINHAVYKYDQYIPNNTGQKNWTRLYYRVPREAIIYCSSIWYCPSAISTQWRVNFTLGSTYTMPACYLEHLGKNGTTVTGLSLSLFLNTDRFAMILSLILPDILVPWSTPGDHFL